MSNEWNMELQKAIRKLKGCWYLLAEHMLRGCSLNSAFAWQMLLGVYSLPNNWVNAGNVFPHHPAISTFLFDLLSHSTSDRDLVVQSYKCCVTVVSPALKLWSRNLRAQHFSAFATQGIFRHDTAISSRKHRKASEA